MAQTFRVLSPGVLFIFAGLRKLLIPIFVAFVATLGLSYILDIAVYLRVLLAALLLPSYICLGLIWNDIAEARDRRSFGAVRVPVKCGKWPGGLDLLVNRLRRGKDGPGYPCEFILHSDFPFHNVCDSCLHLISYWSVWQDHGNQDHG